MKQGFIVLLVCMMLSGCVARIPQEALLLPPESLADRQMQTRRFETTSKATMLSAASGVLQDLGFNLEESEVSLGLIVASKRRDATSGAQVAGSFLLAILGGKAHPVDNIQTIRVSMVMREMESENKQTKNFTKLTHEEVAKIKVDIEKAIANGLVKHYPKEIRTKVASQIAKDTAETLTKDLTILVDLQSATGESTVRVTFQRVIWNTMGQVTQAEQINDLDIYQDFFERLSKSVFLEAHAI